MHIKKMCKIIPFVIIIPLLFFMINATGSKDLIASLAQLPVLADSPEKGLYVDLVKAIDDVYTDGKIKIELYPFPRSINNILTGQADFHIPSLRNPRIAVSIPYQHVTEKMGTVSFVLYSNIEKPVTKKMLEDAVARGGKFPYKIEGATLPELYPFPVTDTSSLPDKMQSINKVLAKRIDVYISSQEEIDSILKQQKIKGIYRELWADFEDVIVVAKGPEGDRINKILSDAIKKLKASGRLQKLYSRIHRPYEVWQPSKMGW